MFVILGPSQIARPIVCPQTPVPVGNSPSGRPISIGSLGDATSITALGDTNADGFDDFAVGVEDYNGTGGAMIVNGRSSWSAEVDPSSDSGITILDGTCSSKTFDRLGSNIFSGRLTGDDKPDLFLHSKTSGQGGLAISPMLPPVPSRNPVVTI